MDSLIKADIFFFISSIALVILTVLGIVVLAFVIKILRDIAHVAATARREVEELVEDLGEMRSDVKATVHATSRATKAFVASVGMREALSFLVSSVREAMGEKRTRRKKRQSEDDE